MNGEIIIPAGLRCKVKPPGANSKWIDYKTKKSSIATVSIDGDDKIVATVSEHLLMTTVDDLYYADDSSVDRGRLRVFLEEHEFDVVTRLAKERDKKFDLYGHGTYGGVLTSRHSHVAGLAAEMAVSLLGGGEIDERVYDTHGDDGIDLELPMFGKVGVKSTSYATEPYMRVELNRFSTDVSVYVLCYVHWVCPRSVWIIGWATSKEVQAAEQKQFVHNGPMNYVLKESELHRWHIRRDAVGPYSYASRSRPQYQPED